jgi:hypothetical protein
MPRPANIIVNLPISDGGHAPERYYRASEGETVEAFVGRVVALHPDWSSAVVVIVPTP